MLSALTRLFRRGPSPQLELGFADTPRTGAELLARLHARGLPPSIARCRLTRNRTVLVSFAGEELRIHKGYLAAPAEVHDAIVTFVRARRRRERASARRTIVGFRIERGTRPPRRAECMHADDAPLVQELERWHAVYNVEHFGGTLRPVTMRVSRRMRTRLGHYCAAMATGERAEIAISRAHLRRHGWEEALHTLLHEMVHQWQDEAGHQIDHGRVFRSKARQVGITASARRSVTAEGARGGAGRRATTITGRRAARES